MLELGPRWTKLARDLSAERGRVALMMAAIAVSLAAVGTMLGAYAILTREIAASYRGTRPASATIEMAAGIDDALIAQVKAHPLVAEAEAREVITARAEVEGEWRPLLLFVVDDFHALRLNTFTPVTGAWPPPLGAMLVERSALPMLTSPTDAHVEVKTPHGAPRNVAIVGVVHDPGLAPAWQERAIYGYVTRETAEALGEPGQLTELRVELRGRPTDLPTVEAQTAAVARWLVERGHAVHELRIPPPDRHPHQRQMVTVLLMMVIFGVLALISSAILVATSLAAMLARQVREIGVMKTIGATTAQIATLYAVVVAMLGVGAVLIAAPLSAVLARAFSALIAQMLNFDRASTAIPSWVFVAQVAAGVGVPLIVAAIPIARAARRTVRATLDDHGVGGDVVRSRLAALPRWMRDPLRRPTRLTLTLGLLSAGGAMFMTALNVKGGWEASIAKIYETRSYDVEIELEAPQPPAALEVLKGRGELWGSAPAAFARPGQFDITRTYPDRAHGSLKLLAPPADTNLVHFPVLAGRWLRVGDDDAVVLNHAALAQRPGTQVGDEIPLSLEGAVSRWRVVGVVEEIGSAGVVYVTREAYQRVMKTEGRLELIRAALRGKASIRETEDQLARAGIGVRRSSPLAELRTAIGDHILILIRSLVAMAVVLAIVGALGLASTMSVSVVERTRELGVLKTIGATRAQIGRRFVIEGVVTGWMSYGLAFVLSLPLTSMVDGLIGNLGFLAPLPLVISPLAAGAWLALVTVMSVLATWVPARQASALPVARALAAN